MMKILVLAPRPLWPAYDGGTVATERCVRGLVSAGADVSILSMRTEKHGPSTKEIPAKIIQNLSLYREVPVKTRIKPLHLISNLIFSDKPYDIMRFKSVAYTEALKAITESTEFDIIHCEGLPFALYLDEIREYSRAPVILRAHNLEHRIREMMAAGTSSPIHSAYLSILSRRILELEKKASSQFDALVPISEPDREWFAKTAPDKPVFLSETGMEEAEYLPEPEDNSLRVGFIGSMNWKPNIDGIKWFVKSVWPCINDRIPSATLHLAGRGIDSHAGSLTSGHNIFIEGEPDDARSFIASNHVMIAPLFAGSGLRIKIIEAMSVGRPVVATPVAAEGLPSGEGNMLTAVADTGSFCSAVTRLLEEPMLRHEAGNAAARLVRERYNNSMLTARLLEFYNRLTHDS